MIGAAVGLGWDRYMIQAGSFVYWVSAGVLESPISGTKEIKTGNERFGPLKIQMDQDLRAVFSWSKMKGSESNVSCRYC